MPPVSLIMGSDRQGPILTTRWSTYSQHRSLFGSGLTSRPCDREPMETGGNEREGKMCLLHTGPNNEGALCQNISSQTSAEQRRQSGCLKEKKKSRMMKKEMLGTKLQSLVKSLHSNCQGTDLWPVMLVIYEAAFPHLRAVRHVEGHRARGTEGRGGERLSSDSSKNSRGSNASHVPKDMDPLRCTKAPTL